MDHQTKAFFDYIPNSPFCLPDQQLTIGSKNFHEEVTLLDPRTLKKEHQDINDHLYGFQSGKKNFSTGAWLKLAIKKIGEVKRRKNIPILVVVQDTP